jgi:hypothetical protein
MDIKLTDHDGLTKLGNLVLWTCYICFGLLTCYTAKDFFAIDTMAQKVIVTACAPAVALFYYTTFSDSALEKIFKNEVLLTSVLGIIALLFVSTPGLFQLFSELLNSYGYSAAAELFHGLRFFSWVISFIIAWIIAVTISE